MARARIRRRLSPSPSLSPPGPDIPEASWRALAAYPRLGIADIGKLGTFGSLLVAVPRRLFCGIACAAGKLVQHAGSMAFGHDKPGSGDRFPATRLLYRATGPAPEGSVKAIATRRRPAAPSEPGQVSAHARHVRLHRY